MGRLTSPWTTSSLAVVHEGVICASLRKHCNLANMCCLCRHITDHRQTGAANKAMPFRNWFAMSVCLGSCMGTQGWPQAEKSLFSFYKVATTRHAPHGASKVLAFVGAAHIRILHVRECTRARCCKCSINQFSSSLFPRSMTRHAESTYGNVDDVSVLVHRLIHGGRRGAFSHVPLKANVHGLRFGVPDVFDVE